MKQEPTLVLHCHAINPLRPTPDPFDRNINFKLRRIMEKNYYECRVYKSVDEKSNLRFFSRKWTERVILFFKGLIILRKTLTGIKFSFS